MTTLLAAGDTLCRPAEGKHYPFTHVHRALAEADLCLLNLEAALTDHPPTAKKHIRLQTPAIMAGWLDVAGIDVAHLDNNHTMDCGELGYRDTLASVAGAGAHPLTVRRRCVLEGVGFCGGRVFAYDGRGEARILRQLAQLLKDTKTAIVSLHWGEEHMPYPSPGQVRFARSLVDHGATVVVGHHPHCPQGIEEYRDGLIAYSLGNFNFWQFDVPPQWYNRLGLMLRVALSAGGIAHWEVMPVSIGEDYRPVTIANAHAERVLLDKLSAGIGRQSEREWYEMLGWEYVRQTVRSSLLAARAHGLEPLRRLVRWFTLRHARKAIAGALRAGPVDRWDGLCLNH